MNENQSGSLTLGKGIEHTVQRLCIAFGIKQLPLRRTIGLGGFEVVIELFYLLSTPQPIQRKVVSDAMQPRGHPGGRNVLSSMKPQSEESILHNVLSIGFVPQ
jgi:hypothetical protein